MSIPLAVCIVGFIVWFVNSRMASPDPVVGEAAKWAYILGLGFWLFSVAGSRVF